MLRHDFTFTNHNAFTTVIFDMVLPPHGSRTKSVLLTPEVLATLKKQRIGVSARINNRVYTNEDIFLAGVSVPAPKPDPVVAPVAEVFAAPQADFIAAVATAEPQTPVPASEADAEPADEVEDPASERRKELMLTHGSTLKAMAKKPPYEFTDVDGLSKVDLVEKILAADSVVSVKE